MIGLTSLVIQLLFLASLSIPSASIRSKFFDNLLSKVKKSNRTQINASIDTNTNNINFIDQDKNNKLLTTAQSVSIDPPTQPSVSSQLQVKQTTQSLLSLLIKLKQTIYNNTIGLFIKSIKFITNIFASNKTSEASTRSMPNISYKTVTATLTTTTTTKSVSTTVANDRIGLDISKLSPSQLSLLNNVTSTLKYNDPTLHTTAKLTDLIISPHLVYRYFAAADWAPTYNGKR